LIDILLAKLAPALPLVIGSAQWNDPVLLLGGDGWRVAINSPWRVVTREALSLGCSDSDAAGRVSELEGLAVIEIRSQGALLAVDPVFVLSNDRFVEVFSVDAVDPWVLRVAGEVYVASPSDADTFKQIS